MKKFLAFLTVIFVCLFYFSSSVLAASQFDVLMNEIAWMGSSNSATDEWIELYNATEKTINVSGWMLASPDGKLKIPLKGDIAPKSFYLMERTDNNTVPNIAADLIYKGLLPNSGIGLELHDNTGNIIDRADYSNGWLAGNNATKQTMERVNLSEWQTSKDPNGTPKAQNSAGIQQIISLKKEKPAASQAKPAKTLPKNKKSDNYKADTRLASLQDPPSVKDQQIFGDLKEESKGNPWFLFFIALVITIISAIIILVLKLKAFKK